MNKIQEEVDNILEGAGWCTEDYVLNFCTHLTDNQQLQVMLKLAKLGKLYKEDSISNYMDETGPKTGKITVNEVVQMFMKR